MPPCIYGYSCKFIIAEQKKKARLFKIYISDFENNYAHRSTTIYTYSIFRAGKQMDQILQKHV